MGNIGGMIFWTMVMLAPAATACVSVAIVRRKIWTALLLVVGAVVGTVLGVMLPWLLMAMSEATTGYGAGNVGVFFCCTIPTFPFIGATLGGLTGYMIDVRPHVSVDKRYCDSCGYDMRGSPTRVCPECGRKQAVEAPASAQ